MSPRRAEGSYLKARETRRRILDAALELFLEVGYEKATMRQIARRAKLAPGLAYYYFDTKEHLIFEFYARAHDEQMPGVRKVLAARRDLKGRVSGVIKAHLDIARPYRGISKALLRTAIDPDHPLSPFAEPSRPLREKEIEVFREALAGSDSPPPREFMRHLPELLWVYKMGVILYWLYDRTSGQRQTYRFVDATAGLIATLLKLARVPGVRGVAYRMLATFVRFKPYGGSHG